MFKRYYKFIQKITGIAIFTLAVSATSYAQLGDAGSILRAGTADANTLMESYVSPFGKGFGAGLNTGWFNTAKTHNKLGFDLTINVAAAVVPTADQIFNVNDLNFSQLELISGSPETPTISGENSSNTELGILFTNPQTGQEEVLTSFNVPAGSGFPYAPSPMVQATVGIIKDTDVSLRFVPETAIPLLEDSKVGLIGFGIKHGINQWIPGGKLLPVDLAIQFGHTTFNSNAGFEVNPEVDGNTYNGFAATTWEGQGIEMKTVATTFNVIVGKTLPFISVYGGLGMEGSTTTISTPGMFPLTAPNTNYDPSATSGPTSYPKIVEALDSPLDIEIEGANSMRAFVGTRLKLAIFQISASYTMANYSSFNVGLGITFR